MSQIGEVFEAQEIFFTARSRGTISCSDDTGLLTLKNTGGRDRRNAHPVTDEEDDILRSTDIFLQFLGISNCQLTGIKPRGCT